MKRVRVRRAREKKRAALEDPVERGVREKLARPDADGVGIIQAAGSS